MIPRTDRVLAGVDGSDEARHALEWSIVIAKCCDAELLVVHAAGLLTHLDEGHTVPSQPHLSELRETFERDWCSPLPASLIPYRLVMSNGPPVLAMLDVAEREDVDLIVVGRHGSSKGSGMLLGSTSHQLAERSDRPVLIVPFARAA